MAQTERLVSGALGVVLCLLLGVLVLGSILAFGPSRDRLEEGPVNISPNAVLEHEQVVRCLAFAPDGRSLAVGSGHALPQGEIKIWDLVTGTLRSNFLGIQTGIYAAAFAPDGRTLATGSYDQTLTLWDVASGRACVHLPLPLPRSMCAALAPDGKTLAVGGRSGDSGAVRFWPVAGEQEHRFSAASGPFAFSVDSRRLALWRLALNVESPSAGLPDSPILTPTDTRAELPTVRVWEIPVAPATRCLRADADYVWALAFSPDGQTLASGGFDDTVKLWDVRSGRERATLRGHTDQVDALAFAPDGQLLASASYDGTVRLWDLATGQEIATLRGHRGTVTCVAFAPDGQLIASGGHDRTVRLWSRAPSSY
jgi:WD40 repeat protein